MNYSQSDGEDVVKRIKPLCPYNDKCYRKNPVHFGDMAHPHLEELLEGQLVGDIILPTTLSFECKDRVLLLDQLVVLRMVLKREQRALSSQSRSQVTTPVKAIIDLTQTSQDDKFLTPTRSSQDSTCSNGSKRSSEGSPLSNVSKKRRDSPNASVDSSSIPIASPVTFTDSPITHRNRPNSGVSIIEGFNSCTNQQARSDYRRRAIMRMQMDGEKLPHLQPPGEFDMKYAMAAPYFVFLSCVQDEPATFSQPYSITFPEILDISFGEIQQSLHINFMVDVGWLCVQYLLAGQKMDCLIVLGSREDTESVPHNIKIEKIEITTRYGCHHTKISVLQYQTGCRIIVSTANLYSPDWENRTQALWISPFLPFLPEGSEVFMGESRTGFKEDFLSYIKSYRTPKIKEWRDIISKLDFSGVEVFFVASIPGTHRDRERNRWGMRKLGNLLAQHAELPPDGAKWPVVAQSSSIGSMGPHFGTWIGKEVLPALSSECSQGLRSAPKFQFVYPTIDNYMGSFDKQVATCCLPYSRSVHNRQGWFKSYMYQWKSTSKVRDQAMPHSKCYTRISPDSKRVPWMVITSANLSKAAWGYGQNSTTILNYEAGIVFFPKFITGQKTFPLQEVENGIPPFPIPYDATLTPYRSYDEPFVCDIFES